MILKKQTIERLNKELSLPFTGIEQDWDLEMASFKRIDDFLNFYKDSYLSNDEKVALMSLILASYDDFLNEHELSIDDKWNYLREELVKEKTIFAELLNYWALDNELSDQNLFKITPLIRMISP